MSFCTLPFWLKNATLKKLFPESFKSVLLRVALAHMQPREITVAHGMQKRARSLGEIVVKLQRGRSPKRNRGPSQTAVYRFLFGSAYVLKSMKRIPIKIHGGSSLCRRLVAGLQTVGAQSELSQSSVGATVRAQSELKFYEIFCKLHEKRK